jgi:transcriptional regulator with XRE-family HTH domain
MANFDAVTTSGAVLGAVLAKLRAEKGMKQSDLAAAVGIGSSTWSRIEKGESGLSIDHLRLAAKALSITPGQLLDLVEAAEQEVVKHGVRIETSTMSLKKFANELMKDDIISVGSGAALGGVVGFAVPIVGTALGAMIGGAMAGLVQGKKKLEK